jgi:flagellar biosynthesis chaperone FliJ
MTEQYSDLLFRLTKNVKELKLLYESEKKKNESLKNKLSSTTGKLQRTQKELELSKKKYDNAVASAMLSVTQQDRVNTQRRIAQMMREIDKCLALIKAK